MADDYWDESFIDFLQERLQERLRKQQSVEYSRQESLAVDSVRLMREGSHLGKMIYKLIQEDPNFEPLRREYRNYQLKHWS